MDLDKFYEEVKDFVLYPGSLEELNSQQDRFRSEGKFEEIVFSSGTRFITGIRIPMLSELEEFVNWLRDSPQEAESDICVFKDIYTDYNELDIRLKAKRLGASGLIYFQYFNELRSDYPGMDVQFSTFLGVPVRYEKDTLHK